MPLGNRIAAVASDRAGSAGSSRALWAPSRIVPPLSVIDLCSSSRQITGCGVSLLNSVEWAPPSPTTFRPNSITAHCIPKQMPRNRDSAFAGKANRLDLCLRFRVRRSRRARECRRNPPAAVPAPRARSIRSECFECALAPDERCPRDRATRRSICRRRDARRICRLRRSKFHAADCAAGGADRANRRYPAGRATRPRRRTIKSSSRFSTQAQRHFVDRKILVVLLDDRLGRHVAKQRDLFPIFAVHRTARCGK